jgi:hypothetical protein
MAIPIAAGTPAIAAATIEISAANIVSPMTPARYRTVHCAQTTPRIAAA